MYASGFLKPVEMYKKEHGFKTPSALESVMALSKADREHMKWFKRFRATPVAECDRIIAENRRKMAIVMRDVQELQSTTGLTAREDENLKAIIQSMVNKSKELEARIHAYTLCKSAKTDPLRAYELHLLLFSESKHTEIGIAFLEKHPRYLNHMNNEGLITAFLEKHPDHIPRLTDKELAARVRAEVERRWRRWI